MSVRAVQCPQCGTTSRVPAVVVHARCPSCGEVFHAETASPGGKAAGGRRSPAGGGASPGQSTNSSRGHSSTGPIVAVVSGVGAILIIVLAGLLYWVFRSQPSTAEPQVEAAAEASAADKPVLQEPTQAELDALVIVDLPEETRRRIYDQVRKTAVMSVEKPLMMPEQIRGSTERTLQGVYDESLQQLAALHDVSVEEVEQIVVEGDTKNWDPSPRSHARRDGKRLYPEERSIGWQAH